MEDDEALALQGTDGSAINIDATAAGTISAPAGFLSGMLDETIWLEDYISNIIGIAHPAGPPPPPPPGPPPGSGETPSIPPEDPQEGWSLGVLKIFEVADLLNRMSYNDRAGMPSYLSDVQPTGAEFGGDQVPYLLAWDQWDAIVNASAATGVNFPLMVTANERGNLLLYDVSTFEFTPFSTFDDWSGPAWGPDNLD